MRQSWPDSGLGFRVEVTETFYGVPSSLGSKSCAPRATISKAITQVTPFCFFCFFLSSSSSSSFFFFFFLFLLLLFLSSSSSSSSFSSSSLLLSRLEMSDQKV